MQVQVIKKLSQQFTIEELKLAETALLSGKAPANTIAGKDRAEKLTHVMAALWVKEEMQKNRTSLNGAMRQFFQRVREAIS
jgi:hypothetical protein